MKRLEATVARKEFSDTLNHVAYGKKRVVVKRHGKDLAAIVPMQDVALLEKCEEQPPGPTLTPEQGPRKPRARGGSRRTRGTGARARPARGARAR
jgi:prevent-host-death family protein